MPRERRRRDLAPDGMRAVELVEADLVGAAPAPAPAATTDAAPLGAPPAAPGRPRHRPRRQSRWVLACMVALVLSPEAGRVAAGDPNGGAARLGGDGVLTALHGPVAAVWSRSVSLWSGAAVVGGVVVGVENTPGGGTDVVAIDADTGDTAWRALPGRSDGRTVTLRCSAGTPRAGAGNPRATVACLVAQRTAGRIDQHTELQVVTLDVATGGVVSRRPLDAAATGHGHPLVTAPRAHTPPEDWAPTIDLTKDGALVARDGVSGSERWRLEGRFLPGLLLVVGTRVVVADATTVVGVDRRTGARLWTAPVQRVPGALLVTDGRLVLTTVIRPDGRGLVALGVDDGRPRWTRPLGQDLRAVVLGDLLYGVGSERLVALR